MAIDIAGLAVRRQAPPPAQRGGTPVAIKKLPDGRICASASYKGATVQVCLPQTVSRAVTVGGTYDVGASYDVGAEAIIGNLWGSIAKGLSKLHHSKAVQAVAAGALSLYGVPPGVTVKAMSLTGDLLDKARAGNPKARARVAQIGQAARQGAGAPRVAAQAILHRNRADRRVRAAMDLLHRAQLGNPRAQAAIQSIETQARSGNRVAVEAQRAMQLVLDASAGRIRPPAPPARGQVRRPPAPPARALPAGPQASRVLTLQNARVLRERRGPDGKRQLLVQVGGTGINWLKAQLGPHRGYRAEAETQTLRELYLEGAR